MMAEAGRTRHYVALDGLRGVAALAVVYYHIANHLMLPWVPERAYLGVDFFFMLSGFVIAHAYEERLRGGMTGWRFIKVRLVRLYPCVLAGLVIGAVMMLELVREKQLAPQNLAVAVAENVLLLPTRAMVALRPWAFPIDGPLWSLSLEIWFNLLYAASFRWLGNRVVSGLLILGGLALAVVNWHAGNLNVGFDCDDVYLGAPRFIFAFSVGLLLRRLHDGNGAPLRWGQWSFLALLAVFWLPDRRDHLSDAVAVILVFPVILTVASRVPAQAGFDRVWRWLGELLR